MLLKFNMEFPLRTVVVVIYSISLLAVYGIDLGVDHKSMSF